MQIVEIFKALSEEIRLRILMLLKDGELSVCDLMTFLNEPQSKVSRHLAYLKQSGLVVNRRSGTSMVYSINGALEQSGLEILRVLHKEMSFHSVFLEDSARRNLYKKSKHHGRPKPGFVKKGFKEA